GGVGIFTGMLGLGGGFIMVPAFVYLLRSPVKIAIGSSMASFVWFAMVGGVIKIAQGLCDVPAALAMGIGAIGGAIIGARLVSRIKPATLKTIFGFIFLYISLKYILSYFGITV
ncbi:MAG: sulfite exporter TauE/SafE family protein, partial [Dehalococcoidales bacterium]|nr:sulfite exporter TauE/SafE family protein [Dehalococcoidales bacterium]